MEALEEMKLVVVVECLLIHPCHNLPFEVHKHASSECQVGAADIQGGKPVVCQSCKKLNAAQHDHLTMEKECVASGGDVLEKKFCSVLLGADTHCGPH